MIKRIISNYGRMLVGWKLWAGTLCVFLLFQLDAGIPISFDEHHWNVLKESYDFKIILASCIYFGMYVRMTSIIATVGFGIQFLKEWKAGIVPQLVMQMGLRRYSFLYTLLAMFSGGLISVIGYGMFVWYMRMHVLLYNASAAQPQTHEFVYAFSLTDKSGIQYVIIMGVLYFFVGTISSVIALCVSTFSENKYLVIFSPYLILRSYTELCKGFGIENRFRLDYYLFGRQEIGTSFLEFVVIIAILLLVVAAIGQQCFKKGVRRKLIHGKY